jgi:hypothetical protein
MATKDKLFKCKEMWKNTMQHRAKADRLSLEMMRHPEANAEHFMQVHKSMQAAESLTRQAVTGLRRVFPIHPNQFFLQHPWNNPEYDRYDESLTKPKEKS